MKVNIHNPLLFHQRIIYDDVEYGTKTPTDLDMVLDFGGKTIIVIEAKYKGNELHTGQRILLETLARGYTLGLLVPAYATHSSLKPTVSANDMHVESYFYQGVWIPTSISIATLIRLAQGLPR
jgi:hypothetical protein